MREGIEISSVNIGIAETIVHDSHSITTGICKRPVDRAVRVGELGFEGDAVLDEKHHGGRDQAVYAYSLEDYEWWAAETSLDYEPGLFGENLTISGLPTDMVIGDRLLIGDVVLEATSARIPCRTLASRLKDRNFGMSFRKAERPGIYFRVLNPGEIAPHDLVEMVECGTGNVTVLDLFRFAYETSHDPERLQQFLEAPIAERVRARIESVLDRMQQSLASD